MYLIFGENKRYKGYSNSPYTSKDDSEIVKEIQESNLNSKIPSELQGDWKKHRRRFKVDDNGKIVFDESYRPQTGSE